MAVLLTKSHRFIKLPPRVKVIATGRPQIKSTFAAWSPTWILPEEEQNRVGSWSCTAHMLTFLVVAGHGTSVNQHNIYYLLIIMKRKKAGLL